MTNERQTQFVCRLIHIKYIKSLTILFILKTRVYLLEKYKCLVP